MKPINQLYKTKPIRFIEAGNLSIPIFSETDEYINNYEKIADDHLNHMGITGNNPFMVEKFWQASEEQTRDIIAPLLKKGMRILDVGVGLGRLLSEFQEYERYGMDISAPYLSIAQKKGINVCYSKIEDMPYKDETFDIIVCTDVLEHVLDLNLALEQIKRVLKKDGHFVMRVPYREDLKIYTSSNYAYKYAHLRNFNEYSIRLQLEKISSFEVLEFTKGPYIQPFLNPKIPILNKTFRRLLRLFISFFLLFGSQKYRTALAFFYNPIEINVLLKKL